MNAWRTILSLALLGAASLSEARERPRDPVPLDERCNTSGDRGGPVLQGWHHGFRPRLLDLSRRGADGLPTVVNGADGLRGHRAGETVRLRVELVDRDGKEPDFPVVLYLAVTDPSAPEETPRELLQAPMRRASLGSLGLPGKKGPCPAVQLLWRPRDAAGNVVVANDEVELTLGTEARLAGLVPSDEAPEEAEALWRATERLELLAGGRVQGGVGRDIEASYGVRPEPGPAVRLRWSGRAPRPAGDVSIASVPRPGSPGATRSLFLGDLYELVDRHGNVVWKRAVTAASTSNPGVSVSFGRPAPEALYEDSTYGISVAFPALAPPRGEVPVRLRAEVDGRLLEQLLTLRFEESSSGSLERSEGDDAFSLPLVPKGMPRTRCGTEELARTVFRYVPSTATSGTPLFAAWLEDRDGHRIEDAELVAFRCPSRSDCEEDLAFSTDGVLHDVRPGSDGTLSFGVTRAPGEIGPYFLAVTPESGSCRVDGLREPFLSRTFALAVGGSEILGPDLDRGDHRTVDSVTARHFRVVDEDEPGPLDLSLSAWDQDDDEMGPVERLLGHRIGRSSTFIGRFNIDPWGDRWATLRPVPRRPTVGVPGQFFIVTNTGPGAVPENHEGGDSWVGRRPERPERSPIWKELIHVNERPGQRLLFPRWTSGALARDAAGGFAVVWQDETPQGRVFAVRARRFGPDGPASPEVTVDEGSVEGANVSCAADGRFVVVWRGKTPALRLFGPDGTPRGDPRPLAGGSLHRVAMAADGRFLVIWFGPGGTERAAALQVQLHDADGQTVGPVRSVLERAPRELAQLTVVAAMPEAPRRPARRSGKGAPRTPAYALVYSVGSSYGGSGDLHLLWLDADGAAVGSEVPVAVGGNEARRDPTVSLAPSGRTIVAWRADDQAASLGTVRAAILAPEAKAAATPLDLGVVERPRVTWDDGEGFALVGQTGSWPDPPTVLLRRFGPDGKPRGEAIRVDPGKPGHHTAAVLAGDGLGSLVVAWVSIMSDPKPYLILARRFGPITPPAQTPRRPAKDRR